MNLAKKFLEQIKKADIRPGTDTAEKKLVVGLRKYFSLQKKFYLEDLKGSLEILSLVKAFEETEMQKASEELRLLLIEIGASMVLSGAKELLSNLNISSDFGIQDLIAENYARNRAGEMITRIDETTRKQINGIITAGIEQGADYNQLSRLITDRFDNFSRYRANLIAVQEIGSAYEYGKIKQADEYSSRTGNQMMKRSITQGDDKVSDICLEVAGQGWIKTEEPFATGLETPPNHVGCRCYAQYKSISNINF